MTGRPITRRRALLAGGAAVAVASSPGSARAAVDKALVKKIERRAVGAATLDELRKMVALEAIANGRLLRPSETSVVRILEEHATQHAAALGQLMKDQLGTEPPATPKRTEISGLLGLRDRTAALRFASRLEGRAIATNISGIRTAYDSQIRQALAGIVGSDAQHLVLLRQLLHEQPVPSAFERGAA